LGHSQANWVTIPNEIDFHAGNACELEAMSTIQTLIRNENTNMHYLAAGVQARPY
jgi:hypothetical protein